MVSRDFSGARALVEPQTGRHLRRGVQLGLECLVHEIGQRGLGRGGVRRRNGRAPRQDGLGKTLSGGGESGSGGGGGEKAATIEHGAFLEQLRGP